MNRYIKLTISILLIAFAIIGANVFIPHKPGAPPSTKRELYFKVAILGVSFLAGFYFLYNSLKQINKENEINSR